jgi:hypothetical protein
MSTQTLPKQKQEHQPGRETEMRPQPDYKPKYPGCRRLRDKVALITGGDSGIGRSLLFGACHTGAVALCVAPLTPTSTCDTHYHYRLQ